MHEFIEAYAVVIGFFMIVGVFWFLLPFAVFGIKPILKDIASQQKELLKAQEETNEQLRLLTGPHDAKLVAVPASRRR